jgi:hypothetical protein
MKHLEQFSDLFSVGIGIMGAILKGIKKRIGMTNTLLGAIVGGVLAYGTVGVIDQFFSHLNERIIIVISFGIGWVANEISDKLDDAIKSIADRWIKKIGDKIDQEK